MSWPTKLLIAMGSVFSVLYCLLMPLNPDEAYYWTWSHSLASSYFDHPPLIAYLIKLATVGSDSVFRIRLVSMVCTALTIVFNYKMANCLFNKSVAEKSSALFFGLPLMAASWMTTPDLPLLLFWMSTLYFFYQGLTQGARYFYYAGLSAGLMLLSKYTGVLLLFSLLIFLLLSPAYRKHLLNKHIYLAFGLAVLLFLPVIIWNSQHDWSSFRFQFAHGMGAHDDRFNLTYMLQFWAAEAGVANPVFFFALLFYCVKERKNIWNNAKLLYLFVPFVFTLLFFAYAACFKISHPTWPIPAYLSGIILLAYWWQTFNKTKLYLLGIALNILLMSLTLVGMISIRYPEYFNVSFRGMELDQLFLGYKEIFQAGSRYVDQDTVVASDSYRNASEAWYYLKNKPRVYILSHEPFSNYNYWNRSLLNRPIKKIIYFIDMDDMDNMANLKETCKKAKWLDVLRYRGPYSEKTLVVYQCDILSPEFQAVVISNEHYSP